MTLRLRNIEFPSSLEALQSKQEGLVLINTINAHSYNMARKDAEFAEALLGSDVLLPDGASVVWGKKILDPKPPKGNAPQPPKGGVRELKRIAGWDLFVWEMERLNNLPPNPLKGEQEVETRHATSQLRHARSVLFLGSTEAVLAKIKARAAVEYPNVEVHTYSPPYKPEFSDEDNAAMYSVINAVQPDVLFVGMTAPKQEKWAMKLVTSYEFRVSNQNSEPIIQNSEIGTQNSELIIQNSEIGTQNSEPIIQNSEIGTQNSELNIHVCCIGAVFDFYAGTVKRAPRWWQEHSLEWLYRLIKEPRRMWRRYLVGNVKFVWYILLEWLGVSD